MSLFSKVYDIIHSQFESFVLMFCVYTFLCHVNHLSKCTHHATICRLLKLYIKAIIALLQIIHQKSTPVKGGGSIVGWLGKEYYGNKWCTCVPRKFCIHDYDIITISHEHCSSRFTGILSLPVSVLQDREGEMAVISNK